MLDDIDAKLSKLIGHINRYPSDGSLCIEFEKLKQLKWDIIDRSIQTSKAMVETVARAVHDEQKKFFIKKNADEDRYNRDLALMKMVETRRSHMIGRGKYVTKHKLTTSFKPNYYNIENIK